jgi:hypothetical protein
MEAVVVCGSCSPEPFRLQAVTPTRPYYLIGMLRRKLEGYLQKNFKNAFPSGSPRVLFPSRFLQYNGDLSLTYSMTQKYPLLTACLLYTLALSDSLIAHLLNA